MPILTLCRLYFDYIRKNMVVNPGENVKSDK